ncbi:hypothetical protein [Metallosphaera sp.]|uniref:hypothetical protein n=1 Tax=Metallosphaera sp. TaxID=2020860 RepID=UPI00319D9C64
MLTTDDALFLKKARELDEIIEKNTSQLIMVGNDLLDAGSGKAVQITPNYVNKTITISDIFDLSKLNVMDALVDDSVYMVNIDGAIYMVLITGKSTGLTIYWRGK